MLASNSLFVFIYTQYHTIILKMIDLITQSYKIAHIYNHLHTKHIDNQWHIHKTNIYVEKSTASRCYAKTEKVLYIILSLSKTRMKVI